MAGRDLLPGELAVLGLLAIRPMYGYEMARYFEREDLAEVLPIEQSLLYTYVRNIEERGLVTWEEERIGLRPPRKTYVLASAGRELLDAWLGRPVARMRDVRLEFLLKLYFLHATDPGGERDLVFRQLEVCRAYRAKILALLTEASGFRRLARLSKLSAADATLGWLDAYSREIGVPAGSTP
jgi:PadR family transcriptional regulator AphA